MSDTYQAIFDAVRSKISNGDVGRVIHDVAFQLFDISHEKMMIRDQLMTAAYEMQRPSAIYRPSLGPDGTKWCALYGDNLQDGVAGFGDTPDEAMADFDKNWKTELTPVAARQVSAIKEEEAREEAHANSQFGVGA